MPKNGYGGTNQHMRNAAYRRDYERRGPFTNYADTGFDENDPDDRYFGSGRQSFGEGYQQTFDRGPWGGDDTHDWDAGRRSGYYGGPERGYDVSSRYGNRGRRSPYRSGYGSEYGGSDYRTGRYPQSEEGFMNDRERYGRGRGWWDRASDEVASWFGDDDAERRREMDERYQTDYSGRGPKNYTRSDERIREEVNDRLTDNYRVDASDIDVEVNDRDVVLSGTVTTRFQKLVAESVAERVSGVKNVENRLKIADGSTFSATEGSPHNTGRAASAQ
jgi:osmotically-inducible protein OsmY